MLDKMIGALLKDASGSQCDGSAMLQIAGALLNNGGAAGGLAGLVQQFQQAGLGQVIASWVSTRGNLPISIEQLTQVFGSATMQQMASQAGLAPAQFGTQLAELLPRLIDQLTPDGALPTGGAEDALAMLSKLSRG